MLRLWYDALRRRILSEEYDAGGAAVKTTRHIYDGLATIVEYECAAAAAGRASLDGGADDLLDPELPPPLYPLGEVESPVHPILAYDLHALVAFRGLEIAVL